MKIGDIVELIEPIVGFDRYLGKKAIITDVSDVTHRYSIYFYEDGNKMSWFSNSELKLIKEIEYI